MPSREPSLQLQAVPCPRCGATDAKRLFAGRDHLHGIPGEFYASRCRACRLWFQNPRPSVEDLAGLYPSDYLPHAAAPADSATPVSPSLAVTVERPAPLWKRALRPFVRRVRAMKTIRGLAGERRWNEWQRGVALEPVFVPNGRLLEIGSAAGERLLSLRAAGWEHLHGVELVAAAAALARSAGFDVVCSPIEQALDSFPDAHFDVVIASMVLEHLVDPFAVVKAIAKKLKPGGQFLFSTVVRDSADGVLFGRYWGGFDFPRHLVYFRRSDLQQFLRDDFESVTMHHQSAPIDFIRSAQWRGRRIDRAIEKSFASPRGYSIALGLAWLRLTCRVSVRARKKSSAAEPSPR